MVSTAILLTVVLSTFALMAGAFYALVAQLGTRIDHLDRSLGTRIDDVARRLDRIEDRLDRVLVDVDVRFRRLESDS